MAFFGQKMAEFEEKIVNFAMCTLGKFFVVG